MMNAGPIETLATELAPPTVTSGFNTPFTIERLCRAFGDNLGGNAPDPSWFEGHEIVAAVRKGSRGTPFMPVAALLRRSSDGALRLIASDHIRVRDGFGADFMLCATHRLLAMEALQDACDEGVVPKAFEHARETVEAAQPRIGEGPVDILAIRRERDDLADIRTAREIAPVMETLSCILKRLSSADRRAVALQHLAALASDVGVTISE